MSESLLLLIRRTEQTQCMCVKKEQQNTLTGKYIYGGRGVKASARL